MATEELPYGKLSREMCKDKRITHVDRTIYAFIKSFVNWRVVQTFIAAELDIGISTVKRSINRLDAAGYLDYSIRETENKRERRGMTMRDEPSAQSKNEPSKNEPCTDVQFKNEPPEEHSMVQKWTVGSPKMNHTQSKNEPPDSPKMNYNKAIDETSLNETSLTVAAEPPAALPSEMTDDEKEADLAKHRKSLEGFAAIINKKPQAGPSAKVGTKIVNGMLLSSLGTVIRRATQSDYEALAEPA